MNKPETAPPQNFGVTGGEEPSPVLHGPTGSAVVEEQARGPGPSGAEPSLLLSSPRNGPADPPGASFPKDGSIVVSRTGP